ncbi:hypothetical protein V498_02178 [Pseudogymnoascus sp. VKM F-4517 (FW-2822)]|nr:hypothetical protein V498_02178 [Pseudogymnoascus sp. VKM F-4517 (FW-2822)]
MPYPESARGDRLFSFKQYVCVITSGGTGIGLMAAQALIANGARVYIVCSDREALVQTAESLRASKGGSIIPSRNASVNLVVAAAGSESVRGTAPDMDAKELQQMLFAEDQANWISTFNTNVSAMYFTVCLNFRRPAASQTDAVRPSPSCRCSRSVATTGTLNPLLLSASKAATIHLSKMMAYEFKEFNVRVNCIAPSYFPSNDKEEGTANKGGPLDEQTQLVPVGEKGGTESGIAQGVLFLAKNRFVTGEVLNIDNGDFLRNPVN